MLVYLKSCYKPFTFKPKKDLLIVLISWILVTGSLSIANYIMTPQRGGLYFIFYAVVGAFIFGVGLPAYWILIQKKESLEKLGIAKKNLAISLILQVLLAVVLYANQTDILFSQNFIKILPLIALALTIGFFEAFFWRGWVITRLEDSFGTIPALLMGCILYSAYHIGYGMNFDEMVFLFFIGLMFGILFILTRNIFVLWPLFQPFGQLITITKDNSLDLPFLAVVGFLEVLVGMIALLFIFNKIAKRKSKNKSYGTT